MKRIFSMLLVILCCITLCACSNGKYKKEALLKTASSADMLRLAQTLEQNTEDKCSIITAANVLETGQDSVTVCRQGINAKISFASGVPDGLKVGDPIAFVGILTSVSPSVTVDNAYLIEGKLVFAKTATDGAFADYSYCDHLFDEQGRLVTAVIKGDKNAQITYEYDEGGKLVREVWTSAYGTDATEYSYDESGKLLRSVTSAPGSVNDGKTFEYTYTVGESGQVLTKTEKNVNSDYVTVYTYTYNDDGTVATEQQKSSYNTYDIAYTYDSYGNLVREDIKDDSGNGYAVTHSYECAGVLAEKE